MPRLKNWEDYLEENYETALVTREPIRRDQSPVSYKQSTQRRAEDRKNRYYDDSER